MHETTRVWEYKTKEEITCILKDEIEAVERLMVMKVPKEDIKSFELTLRDFPSAAKAKKAGGMAYTYRIVRSNTKAELHDYVVWLGYILRLMKKKEMEAVQTEPDQYIVNLQFTIRTSLVVLANFKDHKLTIKTVREVDANKK